MSQGDGANREFANVHLGSLFELDFKPLSVNLLDTLARRKEGYHSKLKAPSNPQDASAAVASIHDRVMAKEEGLDQLLCYDRHRRVSLVDHFLAPGTTLEAFSRAQHVEQGDFVRGAYRSRLQRRRAGCRTLNIPRTWLTTIWLSRRNWTSRVR